jgi:hypothetical protein
MTCKTNCHKGVSFQTVKIKINPNLEEKQVLEDPEDTAIPDDYWYQFDYDTDAVKEDDQEDFGAEE